MRIYIPTYKRADSQTTFENLPTEIQKKVIMVVQQQERDQYDYDCEYLVVADEIGIAKTRELIYYHAGNNHFAMLDDDIKFYRRNSKYYDEEPNMDTSKRLMTLEDWNDWLDQLNTWFSMHDVMHVGHRDLSLPPAGTVQPVLFAKQSLFSTSVKYLGLLSSLVEAPHELISFLLC